MVSKGHNKKRNVGLVFEQALRTVSNHILDSDVKSAKETLNLIREHFATGTELKKELRIFNALLKTNLDDTRIAERILDIAKDSIKKIDYRTLDAQKGAFVNEANRFFGKNKLFNIRVPRFRDYATVQVLMNEWRKDSPDPVLTAEYEQKVVDMMLSEQREQDSGKIPAINSLTLKLMHEKLENKYSTNLLEPQRLFLSKAVFSEGTELVQEMNDTKVAALAMLDTYLQEENSQILLKKYQKVKENIDNFIPENNKESYAKHMTVLHLIEELSSNE